MTGQHGGSLDEKDKRDKRDKRTVKGARDSRNLKDVGSPGNPTATHSSTQLVDSWKKPGPLYMRYSVRSRHVESSSTIKWNRLVCRKSMNPEALHAWTGTQYRQSRHGHSCPGTLTLIKAIEQSATNRLLCVDSISRQTGRFQPRM